MHLILLLLTLVACRLPGQVFLTNIRNVSIHEGLSHTEVFCFHKDARGLMWAGTKYGLNRFDGYGFQQWTEVNGGLASNAIHLLLEDQAGWMWAFTFQDRYYRRQISHVSLVHSISGEVKKTARRPSTGWKSFDFFPTKNAAFTS